MHREARGNADERRSEGMNADRSPARRRRAKNPYLRLSASICGFNPSSLCEPLWLCASVVQGNKRNPSKLAALVGLHPRPQLFERRAGRDDVGIGVAPADDLHADGQAVLRQPISGSMASPLISRGPTVLPSAALSTARQASVGDTRKS